MRHEISMSYLPTDLESLGPSTLTIIIPVHNSGKRVGNVISNLSHQPLPSNIHLRLVACANGCTDNTVSVVDKSFAKLAGNRKETETHLIVSDTASEPQAINRMLNFVGDSDIVIVVKDDILPKMGSVGLLYLAMRKNPQLAAIGVAAEAIPTYRSKKTTRVERMGGAVRGRVGDYTLIGTMYAMRPHIIGTYPDLMGEDTHVMHSAIKNSKGFGIVYENKHDSAKKDALAYYRLPKTTMDFINQVSCYQLARLQFYRRYPYARKMRKKLSRSDDFSKLHTIFSSKDEFSLLEKLGGIGLVALGMIKGYLIERFNQPQSSYRKRVQSAI